MPPEIIDLTGSPPPPSRSSEGPRILNFAAAANSSEQVQFGNLAMPLWPNPNPNLPYTFQQQATLWPASMHTYDPSQAATSFQPNMHGDQVATVLGPVPEASAFLFPHGTRLRDWTPREHELFLMGLIKYGRGRWTKIARHFLSNKTSQQVQSYAHCFFRHLPSTHLYCFRRRNSAYSTASFMTSGNSMNIMGASASYNMPLVTVDNEPIRKALMLFPEKESNNFFQVQVQPFGEASSSINNNAYGLQMQAIGAATSMSASGNYGEVDLELRLGRCQ